MATKTTRSRRARADDRSAPLSPEVRWYLESRGYAAPSCVPLIRTPEPRDVPGAMFDPARVDRVIKALRALRHTQGKWAGRPLEPDAWQVAYVLAPVFGWVAPDESGRLVRIIRKLFVEVPRKNGKTTLTSGLLLYLAFADGEAGAQVYAVAASKLQARFAYDPAKALAEKAPAMRAAKVRPMKDRIEQDSSGSYMTVVSSVGDLIHGANVHGAGIDELHVHKTNDVVDAVESGTGARDEPLVIIITTAGDNKPNTPYANRRDYIERLAKKVFNDNTQYGVVFAAELADDPFSEATWRKANPGYGVSPTAAFMRAEAEKAKNSPVDLGRFLRLHLGVRTNQRTRYLDLKAWDRNAVRPTPAEELRGRAAVGGLDLASVSDLCALCWLLPDGRGGYDALWRHWMPAARLPEMSKRTAKAAELWVRRGWLTLTEGDVVDYGFIEQAILDDAELLRVAQLGYDPYNATQLVNNLVNAGVEMAPVKQGIMTLSAPMKEIQRLMLKGTKREPLLRHDGNGLVRWEVDNLAVKTDASDNVKPDKSVSADKIDGISALATAMHSALALAGEFERESAYEDRGLFTV